MRQHTCKLLLLDSQLGHVAQAVLLMSRKLWQQSSYVKYENGLRLTAESDRLKSLTVMPSLACTCLPCGSIQIKSRTPVLKTLRSSQFWEEQGRLLPGCDPSRYISSAKWIIAPSLIEYNIDDNGTQIPIVRQASIDVVIA